MIGRKIILKGFLIFVTSNKCGSSLNNEQLL
jgi:hypothetical protein